MGEGQSKKAATVDTTVAATRWKNKGRKKEPVAPQTEQATPQTDPEPPNSAPPSQDSPANSPPVPSDEKQEESIGANGSPTQAQRLAVLELEQALLDERERLHKLHGGLKSASDRMKKEERAMARAKKFTQQQLKQEAKRVELETKGMEMRQRWLEHEKQQVEKKLQAVREDKRRLQMERIHTAPSSPPSAKTPTKTHPPAAKTPSTVKSTTSRRRSIDGFTSPERPPWNDSRRVDPHRHPHGHVTAVVTASPGGGLGGGPPVVRCELSRLEDLSEQELGDFVASTGPLATLGAPGEETEAQRRRRVLKEKAEIDRRQVRETAIQKEKEVSKKRAKVEKAVEKAVEPVEKEEVAVYEVSLMASEPVLPKVDELQLTERQQRLKEEAIAAAIEDEVKEEIKDEEEEIKDEEEEVKNDEEEIKDDEEEIKDDEEEIKDEVKEEINDEEEIKDEDLQIDADVGGWSGDEKEGESWDWSGASANPLVSKVSIADESTLSFMSAEAEANEDD